MPSSLASEVTLILRSCTRLRLESPGMRALLTLALISLLLGACGQDRSDSTGECAAAVVWKGNLYIGYRVFHPQSLGRKLGVASIPACNDTPTTSDPDSSDRDEPVDVQRLAGTPPTIALYVPAESVVYVRHGFVCETTGSRIACTGA